MKNRKGMLVALVGVMALAAVLAWASESAPSNTVGFFAYQITTGSP